MEVEKQNSRGGFLQLFDWNLKSRKKLFSNKHEQSENINQGKGNNNGSTISRIQQVNEHGRGSGDRFNSDVRYHCGSSISGDEGVGKKAPGVVARLMGLDSLPTSSATEPYNTLSFESQSFRDSYYFNGITDVPNEHHIVIYESVRNKLDGSHGMARNPLEFRLQKAKRPMERFQSEVLPPRSARLISITHSRLLSPIKSPGIIPPKNAAYIMEAAAKIIDQSPRSTVKGKLSSFGSSSVPLRIQDLKEKMAAAQKSSRNPEISNKQNPTKHVKRQPSETGTMHLFKASEASKVGTQSVKIKEKSVSLAVQAKTNTQKRDGSGSMGKRSVNQKEHCETKPTNVSKNQPNTRKSTQKRTSSVRSSDALKQNNQKQNCVSDKNKDSLKPSISNQKDKKVMSVTDIPRTNKVVNKIVVNTSVGSGKTNSTAVSFRKGSSDSGVNKFPGKKRQVSVNAANNVSKSKEESINWDPLDRKNGVDVVSFTFTSPIKKSLPGSNSSAQAMEKNKNLCLINSPGDNNSSSKDSTASSSGFNVVCSDALSVLLEQKLKELTSRVEFSHEDKAGESFQDSLSTVNSMNTSYIHTKGLQLDRSREYPDVELNTHCFSVDNLTVRATQNWQRSEEMGEHSSCSNNGCKTESDFQYPSQNLDLNRSLSEASCNSLDSYRSSSTDVSDSKWCTSTDSDEVSEWSSGRTPQHTNGDSDLADSASSTSTVALRRKGIITILPSTNVEGLCDWELEYIRNIISNADLMLEEFALGQVHQIMDPDLFDQLESHISETNRNLEEPFKVARKALFDCVEECLELRCKRVSCGSFKAWAKWTVVFQRADRLAEDLYKEILGWTNMVDLMVDEVVDKDMSSQNGKWVEFEIDTFEEGVVLEQEILSSLLDELVDDLLF